jgi:hypothetical protein
MAMLSMNTKLFPCSPFVPDNINDVDQEKVPSQVNLPIPCSSATVGGTAGSESTAASLTSTSTSTSMTFSSRYSRLHYLWLLPLGLILWRRNDNQSYDKYMGGVHRVLNVKLASFQATPIGMKLCQQYTQFHANYIHDLTKALKQQWGQLKLSLSTASTTSSYSYSSNHHSKQSGHTGTVLTSTMSYLLGSPVINSTVPDK